jgi:hypothetical protein
MPKTDTPTGTFSDLYEAMQSRTTPQSSDQKSSPPLGSPKRVAHEPAQGQQGSREVGKERSRTVGREGTFPQSRERGKSTSLFDVNQRGWRKASFEFTDEEFWSLDELKIELQREFAIAATKEDLARCAFNQLFSDYKKHGESSYLVRALRARQRK